MVRQGEEEHELRDVLTALRESKLTPDQAKWLQNFKHHNFKTKYGSELLQRMHSNALSFHLTKESGNIIKPSCLKLTKKIL